MNFANLLFFVQGLLVLMTWLWAIGTVFDAKLQETFDEDIHHVISNSNKIKILNFSENWN